MLIYSKYFINTDKVALKIIERSRLNKKTFQFLEREIRSLKCLDHPNIVKLFQVFFKL